MSQHPPSGESHSQPKICPFLRATGADDSPVDAVAHPSFENRCWSAKQPVPLLLTDQATLCLCSAYRSCPRYLAGRAARQQSQSPYDAPAVARSLRTGQPPDEAASNSTAAGSAAPAPEDGDAIDQALNELAGEVQAEAAQQKSSRQRWGWIGAGLIFMSSLLCGGFFAAYVGWQMVSSELLATQPGSIQSLTSGPTTPMSQMYTIVTATSEPATNQENSSPAAEEPAVQGADAVAGVTGPSAKAAQADPQNFPQAVTPTPVGAGSDDLAAQGTRAPTDGAQGAAQQAAPSVPDTANGAIPGAPTATSPVNLQMQIPTRRPTPVLDIPTSTALPGSPTPTATPTPEPLGTPVVEFGAEENELKPGECTIVSWQVENVRAVYYEDIAVNGQGEREVCLDNDKNDYTLRVVFDGGRIEYYTATVGVILPTETPVPTPTFTMEAPPTPTWTPSAPTPTPTPTIHYGAQLEAAGPTDMVCAPGETCTTDLNVTNTSPENDTLHVEFVEAGAWPRQICRGDGVCSDIRVTLSDMGPGNTAALTLEITVPDDPAFDEMTYRLQASSEAAPDRGRSEIVTVQVQRE